jgi:hypothetical protein
MKIKLKKFTDFSRQILPNEAEYLMSAHRFKDPEKKSILQLLYKNSLLDFPNEEFNFLIDKRKYSYVKRWMEKKLNQIDVDKNLSWIIQLKHKILTDSITSSEENELLEYVANYQDVDFNFRIFYEVVKELKPYLLVRMRYDDHKIVADFLTKFDTHYKRSSEIYSNIYLATSEITKQYTVSNNETRHWEKWLKKVFVTPTIDGRNRYQAFILLIFLYNNYNDTKSIKQCFDLMDQYFSKGEFYSKRFLCNYYASRVLMHSKLLEFEEAEHFAYLSIRHRNNDTLMYLNNLVSILLRTDKIEQAYTLLTKYEKLFNASNNQHQRIGHVSYFIRVLTLKNMLKEAELKGRTFLKNNTAEIFKHRWHHFFTSYFSVLISQEKYDQVLKLAKKHGLLQKERQRQKSKNYIPNISWSISLSNYMEGKINDKRLTKELHEAIRGNSFTKNQVKLLISVINSLSVNLPEVFLNLKSQIQEKAHDH